MANMAMASFQMVKAFLYVLVVMPTSVSLCQNDPLLLTPYIDRGEIVKAQEMSKVETNIIPKSYAGFLTVDKRYGNHLFFWFFPSQVDPNAPLIMWLNGGPGVSSMVGLFLGHGPIEIVHANAVNEADYRKRKITWVGPFSVLFVDNPVGAGFSFSDSGKTGYKLTQEGYTDDLYSFVQQFFNLFPQYQDKDFYLGGQSYAGRYVPSLAHRIHVNKSNKTHTKIPLIGIFLGAPYYDPETMAEPYFDFLYTLGVISHSDNIRYKKEVNELIQRFQEGYFANETMETILPYLVPSSIELDSYDNYVSGKSADQAALGILMKSPGLRSAIHVGTEHSFNSLNSELLSMYGQDCLVSSKKKLAVIMDNYKVLIFSGDYDTVVSTLMVETALLTTPWSMQAEYNLTSRKPWRRRNSCGDRFGFYSQTGRFCRVVVHGAGHHASSDQPEVVLRLLKDFTRHGCVHEEDKKAAKRNNDSEFIRRFCEDKDQNVPRKKGQDKKNINVAEDFDDIPF